MAPRMVPVNYVADRSGLNCMGSKCPQEASVKKMLALVYGIAAYGLFLGTFLYAIGFVGNLGVPMSLDSPASGPWLRSCLVDLGLLSLFALQHSGMARVAFKKQFTRVISPAIERATFVLASSLALLALITFWQPLGGVIWSVGNVVGRVILYSAFACGWGIVLMTTFLINHFELFGLQQVWRNLRGQQSVRPAFVTPLFYRVVRHPLYAGFLLAFWCTPTMTVAHLLFAVMTTAYILVAIQLEERDLLRAHPEYAHYRERVPMLIPRTLGARQAVQREIPANQSSVR
jgi:methanethiol S-methyltransferase